MYAGIIIEILEDYWRYVAADTNMGGFVLYNIIDYRIAMYSTTFSAYEAPTMAPWP
jgi:hypothetical protein